MARRPFYPSIPSSLQATLNRNGGPLACLSAYATLSNAFQLPALEPQTKMHSTQRNKIYLMSFNLTVVLSQHFNRGRHMPCVQRSCVCECVLILDAGKVQHRFNPEFMRERVDWNSLENGGHTYLHIHCRPARSAGQQEEIITLAILKWVNHKGLWYLYFHMKLFDKEVLIKRK